MFYYLLTFVLLFCNVIYYNKSYCQDANIPSPSLTRTPSNFMIGVDNAGERLLGQFTDGQAPYQFDVWWEGMEMLGIDFVSYHVWPDKNKKNQIKSAEELCRAMGKKDMKFLLNLEFANWRGEWIDEEGFNWVKRPDGNHGFHFKKEILDIYCSSPAFWGVIYDEAGHMLINRHYPADQNTGDFPFLAETTGSASVKDAYELFLRNASELVQEYKAAGAKHVLAEYVFPPLHVFSEAGFDPAPKLLKESWAPVQTALGMGSALQYDRSFWLTPDLWDSGHYPGHSPEELRSTLLFAYWMGADFVYVENYNYSKGNLAPYSLVEMTTNSVKLSPYGKIVQWFTKEYIPENPRDYTFRDVKPEVAIIRLEDSDWGQSQPVPGPGMYQDQLYGAKNLHSTPVTRNWIKIWHLLTHKAIPNEKISWNAKSNPESVYQQLGDHYSFVPLNNIIVFDHQVQKKYLNTVKLAFLTGVSISDETLTAVTERVNEGMTVVADPSLVGNTLQAKYEGKTVSFPQGEGKWVLTEDVLDPIVQEVVKPFLGQKNEIRYVFGDKEVIFKIQIGSDILKPVIRLK